MDIYSVMLLVCVVGHPCSPQTATAMIGGMVTNATDSKDFCTDFLYAQLEFNSKFSQPDVGINFTYECALRGKEKPE